MTSNESEGRNNNVEEDDKINVVKVHARSLPPIKKKGERNLETKKEDKEEQNTVEASGQPMEVTIPKFPEKYANVSPLGLAGFGLTTIMLSFKNVGLYDMNSMIVGMGIFYGGFTQFVAGTFEIRKGNTFGGTAFCSYGAFWLAFCTIICGNFLFGTENSNSKSTGTFLLFWFVFSAFMFVGTLKHAHITLKCVFGSVTLVFLLLSIGDYTEKEVITKIGGYIGLLCGALATYTAMAEVIDGEQGYTMMPI